MNLKLINLISNQFYNRTYDVAKSGASDGAINRGGGGGGGGGTLYNLTRR